MVAVPPPMGWLCQCSKLIKKISITWDPSRQLHPFLPKRPARALLFQNRRCTRHLHCAPPRAFARATTNLAAGRRTSPACSPSRAQARARPPRAALAPNPSAALGFAVGRRAPCDSGRRTTSARLALRRVCSPYPLRRSSRWSPPARCGALYHRRRECSTYSPSTSSSLAI
jgi:hypothetical protein